MTKPIVLLQSELYLNVLLSNFLNLFTQSKNLTIDEQLVPFRGRCSLVQFMPKKPAKYGLKFWCLCDAESRYVLVLELYSGKIGNVIQRNLATGVALRLVDQLPSNVKYGRNVTYDRYFIDLNMAKGLLKRKMTSLGVVYHKHAFVPDELKVCRRQLYSSWFYFSGDLTQYYLTKPKRRSRQLPYYQRYMNILK